MVKDNREVAQPFNVGDINDVNINNPICDKLKQRKKFIIIPILVLFIVLVIVLPIVLTSKSDDKEQKKIIF